MEFQPAEAKKFFSTVRKEMALLATSLPDGIMVKTFEDRMVSVSFYLFINRFGCWILLILQCLKNKMSSNYDRILQLTFLVFLFRTFSQLSLRALTALPMRMDSSFLISSFLIYILLFLLSSVTSLSAAVDLTQTCMTMGRFVSVFLAPGLER